MSLIRYNSCRQLEFFILAHREAIRLFPLQILKHQVNGIPEILVILARLHTADHINQRRKVAIFLQRFLPQIADQRRVEQHFRFVPKWIAALALAARILGAGAVMRWKGKKPSAAFSVFVVLFYVAKLFRDFRHWEINPALLDYCFSLFAMIAFMLASYHAGAFSFDRGARRRLAFYSLLGVLFGAVSLAGAQLPELLIYAGSVFWMLACAQQMLKRSV